MFDFLLRVARGVIENVLQQLMQQKNIVAEMAMRPMEAMIQQVVGGVWIGKGADAFVREVQSVMLPGVRIVEGNIGTMSRNIQFARDRIERADEDVTRLIKGSIFDTFKFF
jgi:uncharacterized protein YukE